MAVCCLGCWELPSVDQSVFKRFIVFPDPLPADVLCSGREASALGKEVGVAELRKREGALMPCALSPVLLLSSGLGFKHFHFGKKWKENSGAPPPHRWRKYHEAKESHQRRIGDLRT